MFPIGAQCNGADGEHPGDFGLDRGRLDGPGQGSQSNISTRKWLQYRWALPNREDRVVVSGNAHAVFQKHFRLIPNINPKDALNYPPPIV